MSRPSSAQMHASTLILLPIMMKIFLHPTDPVRKMRLSQTVPSLPVVLGVYYLPNCSLNPPLSHRSHSWNFFQSTAVLVAINTYRRSNTPAAHTVYFLRVLITGSFSCS